MNNPMNMTHFLMWFAPWSWKEGWIRTGESKGFAYKCLWSLLGHAILIWYVAVAAHIKRDIASIPWTVSRVFILFGKLQRKVSTCRHCSLPQLYSRTFLCQVKASHGVLNPCSLPQDLALCWEKIDISSIAFRWTCGLMWGWWKLFFS